MKIDFSDNLWGLFVVFKREFFANLKSIRMMILMVIFTLFVLFSIYVGSFLMAFAEESPDMSEIIIDQGPVFILMMIAGFISFIGPIIAVILGFDTIVKERLQNSLYLLLCRPVGRRAIALGKFFGNSAALALPIFLVNTLAVVIILFISEKGIEFVQAAGFIVLTIVFLAIYLSLAQLISTVSKSTTTAILSGIGIWFMFWLLLPIISAVAGSDNQLLSNAFALINPSSVYNACLSDVLGSSLSSSANDIPIGGYYIAFILWFVFSLFIAIELFNRKED